MSLSSPRSGVSPLSAGRLHIRALPRDWICRCERIASPPVAGVADLGDSSDRATVNAEGVALLTLLNELSPDLSEPEIGEAHRLLEAAWSRLLRSSRPADVGSGTRASHTAEHDPRVLRTLEAIERRFGDPCLRLRRLAADVALSDCRLTQLVKMATGRSFGSHLHARRVAEARELLASSSLSVKEIAARVGYSATTQLDRHFKRVMRTSPSMYRAVARGHSQLQTTKPQD